MSDEGLLLSFTPLCNRHLDAVVEIDASGIPPFWGRDEFRRSNQIDNNHAYVLEVGANNRVIAFVAIKAFDHKIRIMNIGVALEARRQGFGRTLIAGLRTRFPGCAIETLTYERNLPFQLFLKSCGFICTAIVHSDVDCYYFLLPLDSI